jgi:hypothetical protein
MVECTSEHARRGRVKGPGGTNGIRSKAITTKRTLSDESRFESRFIIPVILEKRRSERTATGILQRDALSGDFATQPVAHRDRISHVMDVPDGPPNS